MKKNVIVTGGAGFLGSHLVSSLIKSGYYPIVIDDLSTGSLDNLAELKTTDFAFFKHDIAKTFGFLHLLHHFGEIHSFYNLASPASPPTYQIDSVKTFKTNVLGAINVLDAAVMYKAKVFQASTSEVYGDPLVHPQTEAYLGNVSTTGPRACYDEAKRAVETLMTDYHRQHGVPVKIARIFNTYGENLNQLDGRVVSNFICQALHNQPITLYGTGQQTRSFCYVSDLIHGFRLLMDTTPDDFCAPVNLGNPVEYTMIQLAELIIQLTGSKSELVYRPLPVDDPKQRCPDITLAKQLLKWEPNVDIVTGLNFTIKYFQDKIKNDQGNYE